MYEEFKDDTSFVNDEELQRSITPIEEDLPFAAVQHPIGRNDSPLKINDLSLKAGSFLDL